MQAERKRPQAEAEETPRGRTSKRQKLMGESKQTDAERRELRIKQRKLQQAITEKGSEISEQMKDCKNDTFDKVREKNNSLYDNVNYIREAVIDADTVEAISVRVTKQADKLIQAPTYDAQKLATSIRNSCSRGNGQNRRFCWKTLGLEIGPCFNAAPTHVSFLAGPIQTEFVPKERTKVTRRKRTRDDAEEEEPEEMEQKTRSKDKDKLSAVEEQMKIMTETLKKRCGYNETELTSDLATRIIEETGVPYDEMDKKAKKSLKKRIARAKVENIDMTQFLFNPKSFTQTVENLVGLSFMCKNGNAAVGVRTSEDVKGFEDIVPPGPFVRFSGEDNELPENENLPAKQSVVAFTMKDWRRMCDAYKVEEGDIPHREGSKYAKNKQS